MPGRNKKGPRGKGPRTGRGLGSCSGTKVTGPPNDGRGLGRGLGRRRKPR